MQSYYLFFASRRYWSDEVALQAAFAALSQSIDLSGTQSLLITEPEQLEALPAGSAAVAVPMSGAVQRMILAAAEKAAITILYGAYIEGNAGKSEADAMLRANAAPTLMDCWGVLRRGTRPALLALDMQELSVCLRTARAYAFVKNAKILLIGETEPWVISNAASLSAYERFGVTVERVAQDEVRALYEAAGKTEAEPYYQHFRLAGDRQREMREPTDDDLWNAARMAWALCEVLRVHKADGMTLACFNLLSTGTNCCLGVSWLNDCTPYVAACEGDVDSAVTMLVMKQLTRGKLWMANPGLHPGGLINFSHCTAPLCPSGKIQRECVLRSHHESGIGVSLEVEMPLATTVTACRISDEARSMTVHLGQTERGAYECACRTQMYVRFADFDHYRRTVLGCHQVFAFEDIRAELELLAPLLGLTVL